ncbi:MAG: hypothetical protein K2X44_10830 [Magnetospirillum sp.]|nr:hypothetical protein [Magnetospirillum sp.]
MIHLICLGNPLHSDAGFGAAIHHRLTHLAWSGGIRVFDATARNALPLFEHCDRVIVLEALPPDCGIPGQIMRMNGQEYPPDPHGAMAVGTGPLLAAAARIIHPVPAIEVLGPVALRNQPYCPGLTPMVAAAVQTVTAMLVKELGGRQRKHRQCGLAPHGIQRPLQDIGGGHFIDHFGPAGA